MVEARPAIRSKNAAAAATGGAAAKQRASSKKRLPVSKLPPAVIKVAYPFEYTTLQKRQKAIEGVDFSSTDPVMHYMINSAEANFMSKMVFLPIDWLKTQKEYGQDIKAYQRGGPHI